MGYRAKGVRFKRAQDEHQKATETRMLITLNSCQQFVFAFNDFGDALF